MCGIVGGFTTAGNIQIGVKSLRHRGPDAKGVISIGSLTLGHTRLSILDLNPRSNQPFRYGNTTIVFNGEIWNYKALRADLEQLGYTFSTASDTEVVAAILDIYGPAALPKLNGMFAIGWTSDGETLYLARDRFGEIPLHIARQKPFMFASELKALKAMGANRKSFQDISPGTYSEVTAAGIRSIPYYDIPITPALYNRVTASRGLAELIKAGTTERIIADVPVCTLLSGGIDSASIAWGLTQHLPNLVAYTAIYNPKSRDARDARLTADVLGIELREVTVPAPSASDLQTVINHIEMPYKAQVEIGWACLKLAEQIQADGFKVTFSGEGSDELWASYGFAYHALKTQNWHQYRKDLFLSQARKNFARCNKIFMAHSIECRLPFLHPPLVEYAISLTPQAVQNGKSKPKAVIQEAMGPYLPPEITTRPKIAFQDGMGLKKAISNNLSNARRFYNAEYKSRYC